MSETFESATCFGFPVAVMFTDVEPQVLAEEEAAELTRGGQRSAETWQAYFRRVLAAVERGSILAAGDARRAHFTSDPSDADCRN